MIPIGDGELTRLVVADYFGQHGLELLIDDADLAVAIHGEAHAT